MPEIVNLLNLRFALRNKWTNLITVYVHQPNNLNLNHSNKNSPQILLSFVNFANDD